MAREVYGHERQQSANGGNWTEAEKAEYQKQQQRAFRNFVKYFAGQEDPDTRIPFKAKVIELSEEPHQTTTRFGTRMTSTVKVELVDPPVAGIRFQAELTDNPGGPKASPTIMNPDSALNHLYHAATGRKPPASGRFVWDTREVLHESCGEGCTGRLVNAVIKRGNDRDDGQRGGLWSELRDFSLVVAAPTFEDDEDEGPQEVAPAPKKAARKVKAVTEDDDIPF